MLESGDENPDARTQALAEGHAVGLPYFKLDEARLRYLGGATNHWGRFARPFPDSDFAAKPWLPGSGWPIGLRELGGYSAQAERVVGLTEHRWTTDWWDARDRFTPLPVDPARVVTRVVQIISQGPKSLGVRYHDELAAARTVTVYRHANVTSIDLDESGRSVREISVAVLSGPRFTVQARHFVLAAGGLENPRLLLASSSRFPQGVGNQNDLVGRYFLEHPRFVAGALLPSSPNLSVGFYEAHNVGSSRISAYLAAADDVQVREQILDVQARLAPAYTPEFAAALTSDEAAELRDLVGAVRDIELGPLAEHLPSVTADLVTANQYLVPGAPIPVPYPHVLAKLARSSAAERAALLPRLFGNIAAAGYQEATGKGPVKQLNVVTRIDPAPNRDSRVLLVEDRDELGMRRIALDWRLSDADRYSVRRSMEIFAAEFARAGLGRLRITFDDAGSDWPDDLAGGGHHIGTTRMSPDPKQGVVDTDCAVHGIGNLHVAGSSVFPTSGSATPTLMIIALALRLADRLRGLL